MEFVSQTAGAAHAPGPAGFVSETYRRYKSHTEAFLTWLADQVGNRQFASTNDYVVAAERLRATKPLMRVPQDILKHLQDAISLRQDCTAYYEARGLPNFTARNGSSSRSIESQGHRYFTNVLERLKDILSPTCIMDQTTLSWAQARKSEYVSHRQEQDQRQHSPDDNYYASLMIQNSTPPPHESTLPGKDPLPTVKPPTQSNQDEKLSMREDDALLAMYCLIDDINHVKNCVVSVWEDYRDHRLSLVNAAATSNTLLCSAEHLETTFYNEYRDIIPEEQLLEHVLLSSPEQKNARLDGSRLSDDDFSRVILDHLNGWRLSDYLGVLVKDVSRKDNPDTTGLNPMQVRRARQIMFLREVLLEYRMLFAVYWLPFADDQVAQAFLQLTKGVEVSLWMVVSVQMLIEIKQLLGPDVSRGLSEMQFSARNIVATLDEYKRFEGGLDFEGELPRRRKATETVLDMINWLRHAVLKNVLDDSISQIKEVCLPHSLLGLMGPRQRYFLLANHPILCGRYEFLMKMKFQSITMGTSTWQQVLTSAAHLYNACRIGGSLQTSWGRMEDMLRLWGNKSFFLEEPPSNLGQAYWHHVVKEGLPLEALTPTSHHKPGSKVASKLPRYLDRFGYTRSFDHLIAFSYGKASADSRPSVEHFRLLLVKEEAEGHKGKSKPQGDLSGPQAFRKQLHELFASNEEKLDFNLMYMYRLCARLLRNLASRSGDAFRWGLNHDGGFDLRRSAWQFPVWVLKDINTAHLETQLSGLATLEDAGKYINVFVGVVERLEAIGYLPNSTHAPATEETRHLQLDDEEGIIANTEEDEPIVREDPNKEDGISQTENENPTSGDSVAASESVGRINNGSEVADLVHDDANGSQNSLFTTHKVVPDEPGWKRYHFPSISISPTVAKRAEIKAEISSIYPIQVDEWLEWKVDRIWKYRGAEEA